MNYKVITFYKYINIADPEALREALHNYCQEKQIFARVLLGHEGINGSISGLKDAIEDFKVWIKEDKRFDDLTFREQDCEKIVHHKLVVRVRDEICAFGAEVDLNNKGNYVEPEKLKEWLDNNEDVILLDARNEYEAEVGKFKDAVVLPIETFRDFPEASLKHLSKVKDKKIVMYCTGGIRCEKSSAFLKEHGFSNVHHLKGGIINYTNKYKEHWQGSCFVFDDRLASPVSEPVGTCEVCGAKTDHVIDCHNLDCDKLTVICHDCDAKLEHCCSEECKASPRRREVDVAPKPIVAKITHYYAKSGIACAKTEFPVRKNERILINGKTTRFEQSIESLRLDNGQDVEECDKGEIITFPVKERVRPNDKVLLLS